MLQELGHFVHFRFAVGNGQTCFSELFVPFFIDLWVNDLFNNQ